MGREYQTFKTFYPYYLKEHSNAMCKRLHFVGTTLVAMIILWSIWSRDARWLLLTPLIGYGFAWVGHFFFEKNRPATFTYPLYSLWGDWVMWKDIIIGRVSIK